MATKVKSWVEQNPERAAAGAAYALPTAGVAGLYAMSGDGADTPAPATPAAAAAPAAKPEMPGLSLKQLLPKGMQPGADAAMGHMQNYWPAYAAGGLGLLALTNAMRRRKRPGMQKYSQEFAERHPLVAEFFVKCAHLKLSEQQIEARIRTLALVDDDIRTRFELAFRDDFFKQAGVLGNMGANGARFSNGFWGSLGGGLGTMTMGAANLGNQAWDAVAPKSMQVDPVEAAATNQAYNDSSALAQAGVTDMTRSIAGPVANMINPRWMQDAQDTSNSEVSKLFADARSREGVTDGTRTMSHIAGGASSMAAAGAEILGGPAALANGAKALGVAPGVSTATTAASKLPGAQPALSAVAPVAEKAVKATQFANQPLVPQVANGARQLLQKSKDFGGALRANPVATTAGLAMGAETAQGLLNTASPPVTDEQGRTLGDTVLPISPTGAIDKFVSQPYTQRRYDAYDAQQKAIADKAKLEDQQDYDKRWQDLNRNVSTQVNEMLGPQQPAPGADPATAGEQGVNNPLPGDALPGSEVATTNPDMAAAPQQPAVSPGADATAAGGQPGSPGQPGAAAPAPAGAAQVPGAAQPQPGGVDDAQLKAVAADPNVPPEAKQQMAGAAVTDAASSAAAAKGITMEQLNKDVAGFMRASETPEQAAAALDNLANATAKENPEAAKAPDFMQQLTKQYTDMDPGSKALMFIGGGLGLLGLANALGGEGGIGDWLLAILGIGTAAGVAGGAGMFGQDAQKMIGGMGSQLMGMLPGGQPSKVPPLTPSAAPNPATAPPAAGANVNIPKPAGGAAPAPVAPPGGAADLAAVQKANPWLSDFTAGGTDPKALDAGDAEQVIGNWAKDRMGIAGSGVTRVGVDDAKMMQLVQSLSPEMKQQVAQQLQAKIQNLGMFEGSAKPHLEQLLAQLTSQN